MAKGTKLKRTRQIGFLSRMSKKSGRKIINNKRRKKKQLITK